MKKIGVLFMLVAVLIPAADHFIPLFIGSKKIIVEVADTHDSRRKGLMFRESIPEDYGMLFVFEDEQIQGMWMKNTLIRLDIIFLSHERQVIDIYSDVPPCRSDPCDTYVSSRPAKFALELRGGKARVLKLKMGDTLFFVLNN
jgi:uncharacterized membrane protein (UPF0127 family)